VADTIRYGNEEEKKGCSLTVKFKTLGNHKKVKNGKGIDFYEELIAYIARQFLMSI